MLVVARIFAAMTLPIDVEDDLDEHVDAVRSARPDIRWMDPPTWHITLQFIGECGPREVDRQIGRWSERAAHVGPMTLCLTGMGAFPSISSARVLWAGLGGDLDRWRRIAMPDQEPHVTIGRVKPARDLTSVVGELGDYTGPDFDVREFVLMESHLNRPNGRGPRFTTIARFEFGAEPDKH